MEHEKLKPCPFCGGKVKMRDAINDKALGNYFIFSCDNCEANLNFVNKSENKLTAIEAWNRRVTDNE